MLHDVTMRLFCKRLEESGKTAELVCLDQCTSEADLTTTLKSLLSEDDTLTVYDVVDDRLQQSLVNIAKA